MSVVVLTVPGMVLATLLPTRCPVCGAAGSAPCGSLLAYEGAARTLVTSVKYRNDRAALAWLADGMAALVEPPADVVVTWAPTSRRRRRQRGFDQAELLAAALARRWDRPCRRLLDRSPGPPQTGLSLADRRRGPCFMPQGAAPLGVIVVDDVVTTGSTLTAASWALRSAGPSGVGALTAARPPRPATLPPVPPSPPSSVPLSVPGTPPDVESSLKFGREMADVPQ